jgi:pimeloyl-ACP methyl ester carboxylesterase
MREQYSVPEIRCLDIEGQSICCRSAGRGAPMVLLHAGIANSRMWWPQFGSFSGSFLVVAPDLPGYGSSTVPKRPFRYSDLLHRMLTELRIAPDYDMKGLLSSVNIPLLTIYRDLDHSCVVESALEIHRAVSGSATWIAEGAATCQTWKCRQDSTSRY